MATSMKKPTPPFFRVRNLSFIIASSKGEGKWCALLEGRCGGSVATVHIKVGHGGLKMLAPAISGQDW